VHASLKQVQDIGIVWVFVELESAAVLHVDLELNGVALAEVLQLCLDLLLLDVLVLLRLALARETLPGKGASEEVEQHVADSL
jgi:hypothetical protein